jgi:hypothetical protein
MLLFSKTGSALYPLLTIGFITAIYASCPPTVVGLDDAVSEGISTFLTQRDVFLPSTDSTTVESLIYYITSRHMDILVFSESLYTRDSLLFFISGLLLLTAMLGAIVLATYATDKSDSR